jgi:hypothetical protein
MCAAWPRLDGANYTISCEYMYIFIYRYVHRVECSQLYVIEEGLGQSYSESQ